MTEKKAALIKRAKSEEGRINRSEIMFWENGRLHPENGDHAYYELLAGLPDVKKAIAPFIPARPAAYPRAFLEKVKRLLPEATQLNKMLEQGALGDVSFAISAACSNDRAMEEAIFTELRYIQNVLLSGYCLTRNLVIDDYLNDQGPFASK